MVDTRLFSEHYQVKRTCTDNFEVNFFMVNHACMTEGHRHGHMCFCEEDMCNTGNQLRPGGGSNSNNAFMAAMLASVWAASKTNLLSS